MKDSTQHAFQEASLLLRMSFTFLELKRWKGFLASRFVPEKVLSAEFLMSRPLCPHPSNIHTGMIRSTKAWHSKGSSALSSTKRLHTLKIAWRLILLTSLPFASAKEVLERLCFFFSVPQFPRCKSINHNHITSRLENSFCWQVTPTIT